MNREGHWIMKALAILALGAAFCWANALAAQTASPSVTITLGTRQGTATPERQGFTHTGGGNIDVAQPSSDALVVTMTGVAVAGGHPCKDSVARMAFELEQCFE